MFYCIFHSQLSRSILRLLEIGFQFVGKCNVPKIISVFLYAPVVHHGKNNLHLIKFTLFSKVLISTVKVSGFCLWFSITVFHIFSLPPVYFSLQTRQGKNLICEEESEVRVNSHDTTVIITIKRVTVRLKIHHSVTDRMVIVVEIHMVNV